MLRATSHHAAVRLANGNVLIVGGYNGNGAPDETTLLYRPASDLWVFAGDIGGPRASATATLLGDGRVLATGGRGVSGGSGVLWRLAELWTPTTTLRSDGAVVFAARAPGSPGAATTTIVNTGDSPLLVSNVRLGGSFPGLYAITSNGCSGVAVAPGAGCTVGLSFTPDIVGERTATLTFDANTAVRSYAVALYGTGATPAVQRTALQKINVTLLYKFTRSTRTATTLTRLVVTNVPAGATVKVTCKRSCLRKTKLKRDKKGNVNLAKAVPRRLKAGSVVTVTVSKAGMITQIKTMTIRKRKEPRVTTKCQPPGAKARAC
jgi:hypothetical protein